MANQNEVRFYLYFPSSEAARSAQEEIASDSSLKSEVKPAAIGDDFLLLINATGVNIDEYAAQFEHLSNKFNGELDGWESVV